MKLSRTVAYAVRATLYLADKDSSAPIPCSQLASEGDMPERFLLQILRNLVMHGILRSSRGVDGGYTLVKRPEDLTLLDIIEAVEGPVGESADVGDGFNEETGARLQDALSSAASVYRRQLEAITFAQLLKPPSLPMIDLSAAASEEPADSGEAAVTESETPADAQGNPGNATDE